MERIIEAERIELVINLFGSFDENVRIIEKELDVAVIGISKDSVASHKKFEEKYGKKPIVIDVVIGDGSRKLC